MILSDKDILDAIQSKEIVIDPLNTENIGAASIDLTLGNIIKIYNKSQIRILDLKDKKCLEALTEIHIGDIGFILQPGQFILADTKEYIFLSDKYRAKVEGRSSFGRIGLSIHITAGFIDPGFEGTITLELKNDNEIPIIIYSGIRICQLEIAELKSRCTVPYYMKRSAKYNKQNCPTGSRIDRDFCKGD